MINGKLPLDNVRAVNDNHRQIVESPADEFPAGQKIKGPAMQKTLQKALYRKVFYLAVIGVLLLLLYAVGRPARVVVQAGGDLQPDSGGWLARIRIQEGLTEAQIGKIDPASSTIKLATFGMRGIAISLLWHQMQEQYKRHEWNEVIAAANQLVFLEPHFIPVWDYLGWCLAYNASAEFDDYRERYRWVIRGIDFLTTGVEVNRRAPKLFKALGWTVSQKIGGDASDEREQNRRLLRADEEFFNRHHRYFQDNTSEDIRDNWILGRFWYRQGEELVKEGVSLGNESDFNFFSHSRINLFSYAKWKRRDGIFGEAAVRAWKNALDEWIEFGRMELKAAIPDDNTLRMTKHNQSLTGKLETIDILKEEETKLLAELNSIVPGLKEKLCAERWKALAGTSGQQGSLLAALESVSDAPEPNEELLLIRNWLDKNEPEWRTRLAADRETILPAEQKEWRKMPQIFLEKDASDAIDKTDSEVGQVRTRCMEMLKITPKSLAESIQDAEICPDLSREQRSRARAIVAELDTHKARGRISQLFRGILNYESRFDQVKVETSPFADEGHRLRYEARKAYYDGRIADAITGWLAAMKQWDALVNQKGYEHFATDGEFVRDRVDIVEKFLIILDGDNKIFSDVSGDPVPLRRMMWYRAFREGMKPEPVIEAMEYAEKESEQVQKETDAAKRQAGLEKCEKYFAIVVQRFAAMNEREEFMKFAPFFDLRDKMLAALSRYIRLLEQQNKPLPEPLPLRGYAELMLKHDPAVGAANEFLINAEPLIQDKKYAEAQELLDKAAAAWGVLLEKYPLIAHDPSLSAFADVSRVAAVYAEVQKAQSKPLDNQFPLKKFLPD
ncbi:MAG: hypothetical protein LBH00_09260 [Planctomycetaceae bacterium]|jgi:hypothetical protein|nr:hypothetical protein [Planctomycetaceae bacterium]